MKLAYINRRSRALILFVFVTGTFLLLADHQKSSLNPSATITPEEQANVRELSTPSSRPLTSDAGQEYFAGGHADRTSTPSLGNDSMESANAPGDEMFSLWRPNTETLAADLFDTDPSNRIDAIYLMYGLPPERAVPLLQQVLLTEKTPHVFETAMEALRAIGGDEAVAVVTTGLGETDPTQRRMTIEALGRVGTSAIPLLGEVLFNDPNTALRLFAVQQLSAIGTPAALSLLHRAQSDDDPDVVRAAREATSVANEYPTPPISAADAVLNALYANDDSLPYGLVDNLSSQNEPEDRIDAMYRLREFDENKAAEIFTQMLRWDADPDVRTEAFFALGSYSEETADQAVAIALGDQLLALRHEALLALWSMDNPTRYLVAAQLLQSDPDPALRREAARLLDEDWDPQAQVLLDALMPLVE